MSLKKSSSLNLSIEDARWKKIPKLRARLEAATAATLDALPKKFHMACSLTLLLTKDAVIRRLNKDFRGMDKPTNVLSFPQFSPRDLAKRGKGGTPLYVGDIVIAYQYMVDESKKDHKILINHVTHLFIHGLLHLFGYDHMLGHRAAQMERLETRIMDKLGLPDPYAASPIISNKRAHQQ